MSNLNYFYKPKKKPLSSFVKIYRENKTSFIHLSLFLFFFSYLLFSYTKEYIYINITLYNTFTTCYQYKFVLKVIFNPNLKLLQVYICTIIFGHG